MKYIKHTYYVPTVSKSYSGQVVWRHYKRELIHYKSFYMENKRDLQHPGLEIATDTVVNGTDIFSLATKNSGLVAKVATRF